MSSLSPPLLYAGIGNKIAQRPLDLAPCRCREYAVAMGEIHCFKVVEETVEERAEPEFRDRIEIGERLDAAKKNCAELRAIVQSACQIAPLDGESIDCRLPAFSGLLSNLKRKVNKGWNSDEHRRQLPERCQHFPVHPNQHLAFSIQNPASDCQRSATSALLIPQSLVCLEDLRSP